MNTNKLYPGGKCKKISLKMKLSEQYINPFWLHSWPQPLKDSKKIVIKHVDLRRHGPIFVQKKWKHCITKYYRIYSSQNNFKVRTYFVNVAKIRQKQNVRGITLCDSYYYYINSFFLPFHWTMKTCN